MKIRLVEYKLGVPAAVCEQYNPKDLEIEFVDLNYTRPLEMEGTVEKGPDTVSFHGSLRSEVEQLCGRCLMKIKSPVHRPFDLFYEIKGQEVIETIDDLREVLMLDHPITFVCKENCKGLCPKCGVNLNETRCTCKTEETPSKSSFADLKKIWSRGRKE